MGSEHVRVSVLVLVFFLLENICEEVGCDETKLEKEGRRREGKMGGGGTKMWGEMTLAILE